MVKTAYNFLLRNSSSISLLYEARHDASQRKMKEMREDKAKQTYTSRAENKTAKNKSKDNKRPARAERRAQPRNIQNQMSGSSGSENESESEDSENSWSSDNSESEEEIPSLSDCAGEIDAFRDSNAEEDLPPPPPAAQGEARGGQKPVNERSTRSQSQATPNGADSADGPLLALSSVPSSNSAREWTAITAARAIPRI
jgi:hypothetical protein